jgi:hypothetical protein
MTYRVAQWCTGSTGTQALRQVIDHPALELVGVFVHGDGKDGVDAGRLADRPDVGLRATRDKDTILALDADVVLHNARWVPDASENEDDIVALLRSGKNVVSILPGFMCPWAVDERRAQRLTEACAAGGATMFGTGLAHGLTDWLAVFMTGIAAHVREVRYTERYDRSDSPRPYAVLEVMGIGKPAEDFTPESARGQLYFDKFQETAAIMAAGFGTRVVKVERDVRLGFAPHDLDIAAGRIAKGTVAAVAWSLRATLEEGPDIVVTGQRSAHRELAGWDTSTGWTIEIEGEPSSRVDLHLGASVLAAEGEDLNGDTSASEIRATAAAQVRAIPEVVRAPAGIMLPRFFATWSSDFRRPAEIWEPR